MKKILLILITISTMSQMSFAQEIATQNRELSQKEMQKQNREIVKLSMLEINKTLPQKIDRYTILTKAEGVDTTMLYTFEINTGSKSDDSVRKEDKSRMKRAVTMGVCQSAKKFLEAKISISYLYTSAISKEDLFRFDISQKDCVR